MTVELIILVGIQASGKTTFYRRRLEGRYLHVSLDNWRGKDHLRRRERRAILSGLAAAAESAGGLRGVVVDNTNTTAETRRRYFAYAEDFSRDSGHGVRVVAYFFEADLEACLRRNAARPPNPPAGVPYYVPPAAIRRFHSRLQPPAYAEGFERILRVRINQTGGFDVQEVPLPQ